MNRRHFLLTSIGSFLAGLWSWRRANPNDRYFKHFMAANSPIGVQAEPRGGWVTFDPMTYEGEVEMVNLGCPSRQT